MVGDNPRDDCGVPRAAGIAGSFLINREEDLSSQNKPSLIHVQDFHQVADAILGERQPGPFMNFVPAIQQDRWLMGNIRPTTLVPAGAVDRPPPQWLCRGRRVPNVGVHPAIRATTAVEHRKIAARRPPTFSRSRPPLWESAIERDGCRDGERLRSPSRHEHLGPHGRVVQEHAHHSSRCAASCGVSASSVRNAFWNCTSPPPTRGLHAAGSSRRWA